MSSVVKKYRSFNDYVKSLHVKLLPGHHDSIYDHVVQAVIDKCVEEGLRKAVISKKAHEKLGRIGDTTIGASLLGIVSREDEKEVDREVKQLLEEVKKKAESANIQPYTASHEPTPREWNNWNKNQKVVVETHHPKDLKEIQALVGSSTKKTRAVGFGHSWAPIVLSKEDTNVVPPMLLNTNTPNLKKVLSTPDQVRRTNTVTFECGVSVKDLEDWLQAHAPTHTIGSNVVLTEVHLVALTTCVCHGTGFEWASVADMIRAVSVVDVTGKLTTYADRPREQLSLPEGELLRNFVVDAKLLNYHRAAMGMLGVIYSITLDLVHETHCRYKCQGICQDPLRHPVPALRVTDRLIPADSLRDPKWYQTNVGDHGWAEIFWAPGGDKAWVKSWEHAPLGATPEFYDTQCQDFLSTIVATKIYRMRRAYLEMGFPQSKHLNKLFMRAMNDGLLFGKEENPKHHPIYKWYDSIHFRNFITETPVEDTEFAFPISKNYETAARAFSELQDRIRHYAKDGKYPVDIVCEMRFTHGSNATLLTRIAGALPSLYFREVGTHGVLVLLSGRLCNSSSSVGGVYDRHGGTMDEDRYAKRVTKNKTLTSTEGKDVFPHWAKGWQKIPHIEDRMRNIPGVRDFAKKMREDDPAGKFHPQRLAQIFNGL